MAIICKKHKLLFIMVPGTGCSVVGRVLQQHLGGEWLPDIPASNGAAGYSQRKHNTLSDIYEAGLLTPKERSEYLVFATVRNPFDRWVTYYQRYAGDWIDYYGGFAKRQLERDREAFDLGRDEYERLKRQRQARMDRLELRRKVIRAIGFNLWMKGTLLRWYAKGGNTSEGGRLHEYAFPMLGGADVVMRQEQLENGFNAILKIAGLHRRLELPRRNVTSGKKKHTEYWSTSTRLVAEILLGSDLDRFGYRFEGPSREEPLIWLDEDAKAAWNDRVDSVRGQTTLSARSVR